MEPHFGRVYEKGLPLVGAEVLFGVISWCHKAGALSPFGGVTRRK